MSGQRKLVITFKWEFDTFHISYAKRARLFYAILGPVSIDVYL